MSSIWWMRITQFWTKRRQILGMASSIRHTTSPLTKMKAWWARDTSVTPRCLKTMEVTTSNAPPQEQRACLKAWLQLDKPKEKTCAQPNTTSRRYEVHLRRIPKQNSNNTRSSCKTIEKSKLILGWSRMGSKLATFLLRNREIVWAKACKPRPSKPNK